MLPPRLCQLFNVAAQRASSELEREELVERAQLHCFISRLAEHGSNFVEQLDGGPVLFVWSGLEVDVRRAKREQRAEQRGLETAPRLHPFFGDAEEAGHVVAVVRAGRDELKQTRMKKGHRPFVVQNGRRQRGVVLLGIRAAYSSGLGLGKDGRPNGFPPDVLLLSGDSGGISSRSRVLDWCASGWRLRLYERRAPRRISL